MYGYSQAKNPSEPCSEIPRAVWFKMNDTETEIFIRSNYTIYERFMSEVQKFPTFMVIDIVEELDENVQNVIEMIQDLIKSLDENKNKEEISFWISQIVKLREDVFSHKRIHVRSCRKDSKKDRE